MSYDNFAQTFSESRKNHPWPEIDSIIKSIIDNHYETVLDVGCGNGRFLEEAEKSHLSIRNYLGVDSSTGMITEARKLHETYRFEACDMMHISDLTFSDMHFDVILLLASFHHLESKEERIHVLKSLKKRLSPHGRIYMTNWNLLDQKRYEKNHIGNGDFDIKIGAFSRYYHGFTLIELEELFMEAGLEIHENKIFEGGRNSISILR